MRLHFETVIESLDLLGKLAGYHPVVIGTPPLGIDTDDSDIDIACTADDLDAFGKSVERMFGHLEGFSSGFPVVHEEPAILVSFGFSGWDVELFCQKIDTGSQWGVRHFRIEQRLLALEPELRHQIRDLKRLGSKTEPAFARVLRLSGDPYRSILDLESKPDDALRELLKKRVRHVSASCSTQH